jgi:hypothetical protein
MDREIQQLVRRYRVTWETRPELAPKGPSVAPIGFAVELSAVSDHPDHDAEIACPDCRAIEDALGRVIGAIAPMEVTHVGRGERQLGAAHDGRPEVTASVTVLHRDGGGANRPPDDDERRRLAAIVARLRNLGAQEGHWRDESAPAVT